MSAYPFHTRIVTTNAKIESKQGEKDPFYHTRLSNNPTVKVTERFESGEYYDMFGQIQYYSQNFKVKTGTDFDNGYFSAVPDGNFLVTYMVDVNGKVLEKSESFVFQPYQQLSTDLPNNPVDISELLYYQTIIQLKGTHSIDPTYSTHDYFDDGLFYSVPDGKYLLTYEILVDGKLQERSESFDFLAFFGREPKSVNVYGEIKSSEEAKIKSREAALEKLARNVNQYVSHGTNKRARAAITEVIDELWPTLDKEMTVFRAQTNPFVQEIRTGPDYFFSTSDMMGVSHAKPFFSFEDKCCLFILHVQPGVKYYQVSKTTSGFLEREFLIEGNGRFYQDREKTTPGFRELTMDEVRALIFGQTNFKNIENINSLNLNTNSRFKNLNSNEKDRLSIKLDVLKEKFKSFGAKTHTKPGVNPLEQKSGIFEAYYFPPADRTQGGKRRKTYKNKKNKRKHTRKH